MLKDVFGNLEQVIVETINSAIDWSDHYKDAILGVIYDEIGEPLKK